MTKKIIILLISIGLFSSCAITKRDKFNAVNDYLDSVIADSEEIMIIHEKMSPDLAIIMLYGHDFWTEYPDTTFVIRENGIHSQVLENGKWVDLFDKKDWLNMKKKYGDKIETSTGDNGYWQLEDFRHNNIVFEKRNVFFKNLTSYYFDQPRKKVFEFSFPISYKKKYLVFSVTAKTTHSTGRAIINLTVVMEKLNGKWIVVDSAGPSYFD
ncbi:hypothetical protein NJT12_21040 [Flavobacterium sp. AC]|uniref:Lipoprotein n=1 Tax=Flavobacterium azizsancarii TaxID=2961580 RepID=A0ABT4WI07_9FLAO|nr:hypothetical protein [Flavobacterium azizsancarii]MDA6072117.1 hypothetical protein [Flavobacterium azizsancarii]